MKILLLEDDQKRIKQFQQRIDELNDMNIENNIRCELIHVETAKECIALLEADKFNLILLDHDLGGKVYVSTDNTNTGSEVARWINKNPDAVKSTVIITHTFNPVGARNILDLIPNCLYVPSIWVKDKFHKIIKVN